MNFQNPSLNFFLNGRTHGRTDARTDERTEGRTFIFFLSILFLFQVYSTSVFS